ncbi:response regulator, partial [Streptomyces sp. NPDC002130]|uniref:response regulator n=1 Tax=Streptomyces sp. NPDC002130 TaxID=3155568 RepID=UPI00332F7F5C
MSTRERILIVDDDTKVLNSLERGLRLSGFDTATAVDGRSALASVNKQCPAALVLDVNMPGLDGVGVVTALRAIGNEVPICVLSARSSVGDRIAGLEAARSRRARQTDTGPCCTGAFLPSRMNATTTA